VQLVLRAPADWAVRKAGATGQRIILRAPGGVTVDVHPLQALPDDLRMWMEHTLLRNAPAGARARDLMPILVRNDTGWPMEVLRLALFDASGTAVEHRMGAFFQFEEYVGSALAMAGTAQALDLARDELVATFQTGRPDWRGSNYVAVLSELWG
jgi:hypothetical protein